MSDWFSALAAGRELPPGAASELQERGFVVLPGPVTVTVTSRLWGRPLASLAIPPSAWPATPTVTR